MISGTNNNLDKDNNINNNQGIFGNNCNNNNRFGIFGNTENNLSQVIIIMTIIIAITIIEIYLEFITQDYLESIIMMKIYLIIIQMELFIEIIIILVIIVIIVILYLRKN